jgi:porphobilinogen synthase
VLFNEGAADIPGTHARLSEIALVHADAGADLVVASGMLDGAVRAIRTALSSVAHDAVPVAGMVKLDSKLYASHRRAVEAMPLSERAVPLIDPEDREAARARAVREVADGADAMCVKPGLATLDHVTRVASAVGRPVISFFTADEHALFASNDALLDVDKLERESLVAARRAGADLVISYGALAATES